MEDEEEGEEEESAMGWINLKAGWSAPDKLGWRYARSNTMRPGSSSIITEHIKYGKKWDQT